MDGGASADVRRREKIFDAGMPDKPGGKAFPKGILWKRNLIDSKLSGFNSPSCVQLNTERNMSMPKSGENGG